MDSSGGIKSNDTGILMYVLGQRSFLGQITVQRGIFAIQFTEMKWGATWDTVGDAPLRNGVSWLSKLTIQPRFGYQSPIELFREL
jgi:hypothetical protein